MRYDSRDFSSRKGSLLTEVALIGIACMVGWTFMSGTITISQVLHFVGLR